MNTIYKYPVQITDVFWLGMPEGAEVLTVQVQQGKPVLWAKVNTGANIQKRWFRLVGTGEPAGEDTGLYVGSFQLEDGALVYHLFDGG